MVELSVATEIDYSTSYMQELDLNALAWYLVSSQENCSLLSFKLDGDSFCILVWFGFRHRLA